MHTVDTHTHWIQGRARFVMPIRPARASQHNIGRQPGGAAGALRERAAVGGRQLATRSRIGCAQNSGLQTISGTQVSGSAATQLLARVQLDWIGFD